MVSDGSRRQRPSRWRVLRQGLAGAVCIGRFGRERRPGVVVVKEIWGKDGIHYDSHRHTISRFDWDGNALKPTRTLETRAKQPGWREAADEQGYHCKRDFVVFLVPEYR